MDADSVTDTHQEPDGDGTDEADRQAMIMIRPSRHTLPEEIGRAHV